MSFTEWYEDTYKEKWKEDYAFIYSFADEVTVGYKTYCNKKGIRPIWNG